MQRYILITIIGALVGAPLLLTVGGRTRAALSASAAGLEAALHASVSATAASSTDTFIAAHEAAPAPALAAGTWINTAPLTLKGLRGRVVLVEFWTFGCYNCRNTLPAVKRWAARYEAQGLTVIGVHTPETDHEKDIAEVRNAVRSLGVRYPVVTDDDFTTWRAYGVAAWPTIVVLDKEGRIRWTHIGEGRYDETEDVIRTLIKEAAANPGL